MQVVILCGGLATRLGNLAKNTPKSMIKIHEKPFLEYQIEQLKQQNIEDIVLCVGHLQDQIKEYFGTGEKHGVSINYSTDGETPLGPIGALKKAEPYLKDTFFTLYGDSYGFIEYDKVNSYFEKHDKPALMTVLKNNDKYDKSNVEIQNNIVTKYSNTKTKDMIYIDYGVSLFNKQILNDIPKNTFYSTKDLFSKISNENKLLAYEIDKRFYHIGTPEALEEFTKYIKQ